MLKYVVNTGIMANPMNWVTVVLMVMLASIAVKYITLTAFDAE